MNNLSGSTLSGGIEGYFPYIRLIKAMIGHAVIDSKKNYDDYKWLMKSELAELYCETVGMDIAKVQQTADKIRRSNLHWRRLNKKVQLVMLEDQRLKIDDATAKEIQDIREKMKFNYATLAKLYNVSTATICEVVNRVN